MAIVSSSPDSAPAPVPEHLDERPPFWRAILIGIVLLPLSIYYGNYAYVVVQALLWGQTSLLRGPVFVLFILTLLNLLFRKVAKRAGLHPWEMLIIYSMVALSVCLSGFGQIQWLINILPAGMYYATPSNHYDRFLHLVPHYLAPHNPRVINDFFIGRVSMYRPDILADWAGPVIVWSLFLCGIYWVTLCLCSLIRRSWVDEEKLTFPLVYLPLEMAAAGAGQTPFFRNRLMWAGFALAGILESVDYLNFFFPAIPYVPIKPTTWHLQDSISNPPWNSIGMFTLAFYPFAIGIAFLLSLEVSFSCWFFYLLTRVENIGAAALGLNQGGAGRGAVASAPFLGEQGVGAFVALGVFLLYRARKPLGDAMRAAWDREARARSDDPNSPLSLRAAFWGGLVGITGLTAFLVVIGLPLWIALLFWALYFLFVLVLTRVIAEAGAGWAWGPMNPLHGIIMDLTGVGGLDSRSLTMFSYLAWFDVEYRDSPMPHQLEAMKLAQESRTPRRQLLWALLIAAVLSTFVSFWAYLHMYYEFGAASAKVRPALQSLGPGTFTRLGHWLNSPTPPDGGAIRAMVAGGAIVLALAFLRQNFVWWPLHPIGYVLAGTLSMEYMWCPFFLAWLAKTAVMRYGGVKLYRQALPFFLGLILGDYIVPTLWGLWGTVEHTQVYMAFPH